MDYLAGQSLLTADGRLLAARSRLAPHPVWALYFSAHWCPPCRVFTPMLQRAYQNYLREWSGPGVAPVEVVFVSSDRSQAQQLEYMREAHGDWPAVPAGSGLAQSLGSIFGVRGIPALVVINASDGSVITQDGRQDVSSLGPQAFRQWAAMATPEIDTSIVNMLNENSDPVKRDAGEILLKLIGNVLREPNNIKFRSIKLSNPKIESKLLTAAGGSQNGSPATPVSAPTTTPSSSSSSVAPNPEKSFQHLKKELEFFQKLEAEKSHVLKYEDPNAQDLARQVIPVGKLEDLARAKFDQVKAQDPNVQDPLLNDLVLLELMNWFKTDFFTWMDAPKCDSCGGKTDHAGYRVPTQVEQIDGAGRVEGYNCSICQKEIRFPRYHGKPEKLLTTRQGRCGEWANCFALMCRALGFDTRHVLDWTDHVWVEVFSQAENRWLHVDPCENVCDQPLIYEIGWGKKLSYVIAASKDEIQDVSYRYSCDHEALKSRRMEVRENWLTQTLLKLTKDCQKDLDPERVKLLTERRLIELVQLMSPIDKSKIDPSKLSGRQSGSAAWRLARGEMGLGLESFTPNVWKLTDHEVESKTFHLKYNVVHDQYRRVSNNDEVISGWDKGVLEAENVLRKLEADWKQCYLARREGAPKSSIKWELDLENTRLSVQSVELHIESSIFGNGRVLWQLCGGNTCLLPSSGTTLKSEALSGSKKVSITAHLSGGEGENAWQSTQLFRTPSEGEAKEECKFRFLVKLKDD
ncbi:hypothetical protein TCAL_03733 [Tigriopus californicus]|uniref:Peptide-N(4)-(N-acetyl-beta-glucosaminyl)asparagine amidase n=1 Tax=Tigriopus californicus TaxID=6832 RepID=A0A553NND8_TIGCA|nr:hypothetical protein TCAL_03733 [Tigriopus californicus]